MLARFVKLFHDVSRIEDYLARRDRPLQPEVLAKRTWLTSQVQLIPSRSHCEAVRELLYWIYVGEQVMQRDGASVIHATFIFEEICDALCATSPTPRVPRCIQSNMDVEAVSNIVASRRELLQTSGVYYLSLVMWPKPTSYAFNHHNDACNELETFITRSWSMWQTHAQRECLGLQSKYLVGDATDGVEMQSKLDAFIEKCQEELTEHLIPSKDGIKRHQARFAEHSKAISQRLSEGDRVVKRGRVDTDTVDDTESGFPVRDYWRLVAGQVPQLALIARLLLSVCATEAGVERMFSKEGFIHDSYRNKLGHDILLALVRSCMNRSALLDEALNFDSDDSDE